MNWWLPPESSTFAPSIDLGFLTILIITGITFVLVEVGLIVFVLKYRARPGQKAHYTHGSTPAEVIWTAVPAVTMVILGIVSNGLWVKIKGRNSVPAGANTIGVHAKQFEWWFTYPGADGKLGTADDVTQVLSGFTREIKIVDLSDDLRSITVTVTYQSGPQTKSYSITAYISTWA